jgi:hypothetical protein
LVKDSPLVIISINNWNWVGGSDYLDRDKNLGNLKSWQ